MVIFWFVLALVILSLGIVKTNFLLDALGLTSLTVGILAYLGFDLERQLLAFGFSFLIYLFVMYFISLYLADKKQA